MIRMGYDTCAKCGTMLHARGFDFDTTSDVYKCGCGATWKHPLDANEIALYREWLRLQQEWLRRDALLDS